MTDSSSVLVTGASGLVGSDVVARLTAQGRSVIAVSHRNKRIDLLDESIDLTPIAEVGDDFSGVAVVNGDVRQSGLGMSETDAASASERVGLIVHSAATTAFDAPEELYQELNVGATQNVIALAQRWQVPLVYVSTAYVAGNRPGTIPEGPAESGHGFTNGYERSKFTAEGHVRAADGLRWAIVRPGIVTGSGEDGSIRDFKNLYTMLKLIVEGKVRSLPGRYDATLSLAPVDHVAKVIVEVVRQFDDVVGGTFHAVGADPVSLRELSDVLAEYPSFAVAKFVPESSFSEDQLEPLEREYYRRIAAQYVGYLNKRPTFDATRTRELIDYTIPAVDKDYLRDLLDYAVEREFLGNNLPSLASLLASH